MDRRLFTTLALGAATTTDLWAQDRDDEPVKRTFLVGVIGHTGRGNFGHGLDTLWQQLPNASIVGVADANKVGLQKELKKLGLESLAGFHDYRQMLSSVRPDIVAVCPRHPDQHHDMILAAVESGVKGIYVEKPFVRTPAEADAVVAACRRGNAKLAVAHRNRYHPALQAIEQVISNGKIGRLLEIRGRGKGDRRGGSEDLWVLGSHVMNLVTFFGGMPLSVSASLLQDGRRVTKQDIVEGAEALGPLAGNEIHARFLLKSGLTATFDSIANDNTNSHGFGLQLVGSDGIINLRCDKTPLAHLVPGNPFRPTDSPRPWIPISSRGPGVPEPIDNLHQRIHEHLVPAEDLITAIKEDREPRCNADEAAATVEMICGIFESHRQSSRAVSFPLSERDHPLRQW